MRKKIALMLAAAWLLGLFGCTKSASSERSSTTITPCYPSTQSTASTSTTNTTTQTTQTAPPEILQRYQVDYEAGYVAAGELDLLEAADGDLRVSYGDAYKGRPGYDYSAPQVFTLNEYLIAGQSLQWSPLNWQTPEDAYVLEYTTMGLYSFALSSDLSGWTILCEMAAAPPEDVTEEYSGQFGICQGESAKAWRIALNPRACWSNGQPITAQSYVYSYQQLLDSRLEDSRAAEVCRGDLAIAGAAEYYAGSGSWENVGILASGEYELVLITERTVEQPEFYVPYYLQSSYLVYEPLWESCKQFYDAQGNPLTSDGAQAVHITTSYGTSPETSISYGPYVLVGYRPGDNIAMERNFTWYGYSDGKHLGQYQTDEICCLILPDYETAVTSYKNGRIDRLQLQHQDVEAYLETGLLRYQEETYTTKLTFNTDPRALSERGTLVLANAHFRKALSLALDRSRLGTGMPGLGLVNAMYLADVGTGLAYRNTFQAQHILAQLYGEDSGYDLALAQNLMQHAFVKCLEDGSYDGNSPIVLQLSVYRQEEANSQLAIYLQEAIASACQGTGFADKITLELVVDENCYGAMAQGRTDMILTTWGGNPCDPYDLFYQCYCSDQRMEYGFDPAMVTVQIGIQGEEYIASLLDWAVWCAGGQDVPVSEHGIALLPFSSYSPESKAAIFAQLEYAYLSQYATVPLYSRGSVWLLSEKGDYAVKNARSLVGFGGVRYYTFAYSDQEWLNR